MYETTVGAVLPRCCRGLRENWSGPFDVPVDEPGEDDSVGDLAGKGGHFGTDRCSCNSSARLLFQDCDRLSNLGEGTGSAWRTDAEPQAVFGEIAAFDLVDYFCRADFHEIENTHAKVHPGAHRGDLQDAEGSVMGAAIHPERLITSCLGLDRDLSRYIGWDIRIDTESAHGPNLGLGAHH